MADTVTSQTIINGARNLIIKLTNESDGTGESAVTKVDATNTALGNLGVAPGIHLKVARIIYDIRNMGVRLLWAASANTDMVILGGFGTMDYTFFGGLTNPAAIGATGSILLTTVGAASGSSYTITLEMLKCV